MCCDSSQVFSLLSPLLNAVFGRDAALSPLLASLFYSLPKSEVQPWEETWPYHYTPVYGSCQHKATPSSVGFGFGLVLFPPCLCFVYVCSGFYAVLVLLQP